MDDSDCSDTGENLLNLALASSVLDVKGPFRFRCQRSKRPTKAHAILRRVDDTNEYGKPPRVVCFALFANKQVNLKPGKEILLTVETDGELFDGQVVRLEADILDSQDVSDEEETQVAEEEDLPAVSPLPSFALPPKMRKWTKKVETTPEPEIVGDPNWPSSSQSTLATVDAQATFQSRSTSVTPSQYSSVSVQTDTVETSSLHDYGEITTPKGVETSPKQRPLLAIVTNIPAPLVAQTREENILPVDIDPPTSPTTIETFNSRCAYISPTQCSGYPDESVQVVVEDEDMDISSESEAEDATPVRRRVRSETKVDRTTVEPSLSIDDPPSPMDQDSLKACEKQKSPSASPPPISTTKSSQSAQSTSTCALLTTSRNAVASSSKLSLDRLRLEESKSKERTKATRWDVSSRLTRPYIPVSTYHNSLGIRPSNAKVHLPAPSAPKSLRPAVIGEGWGQGARSSKDDVSKSTSNSKPKVLPSAPKCLDSIGESGKGTPSTKDDISKTANTSKFIPIPVPPPPPSSPPRTTGPPYFLPLFFSGPPPPSTSPPPPPPSINVPPSLPCAPPSFSPSASRINTGPNPEFVPLKVNNKPRVSSSVSSVSPTSRISKPTPDNDWMMNHAVVLSELRKNGRCYVLVQPVDGRNIEEWVKTLKKPDVESDRCWKKYCDRKVMLSREGVYITFGKDSDAERVAGIAVISPPKFDQCPMAVKLQNPPTEEEVKAAKGEENWMTDHADLLDELEKNGHAHILVQPVDGRNIEQWARSLKKADVESDKCWKNCSVRKTFKSREGVYLTFRRDCDAQRVANIAAICPPKFGHCPVVVKMQNPPTDEEVKAAKRAKPSVAYDSATSTMGPRSPAPESRWKRLNGDSVSGLAATKGIMPHINARIPSTTSTSTVESPAVAKAPSSSIVISRPRVPSFSSNAASKSNENETSSKPAKIKNGSISPTLKKENTFVTPSRRRESTEHSKNCPESSRTLKARNLVGTTKPSPAIKNEPGTERSSSSSKAISPSSSLASRIVFLPPKPSPTLWAGTKRERAFVKADESLEPQSRKRLKLHPWPTISATHTARLGGDESQRTIKQICVSHKGSLFALSCSDRTIRIWDNDARIELARLTHNAPVINLDWMENDVGIILLGGDGIVSKWARTSVRTGAKHWTWCKITTAFELPVVPQEAFSAADCLCMAYVSNTIAVSVKSSVKVWQFDRGSWQSLRSINRPNVTTMTFLRNGLLLGGTKDGVLWTCEVPNGTLRAIAFLKGACISRIDVNTARDAALVTQGTSCNFVNLQQERIGNVERGYQKEDRFGGTFAAKGEGILFGTSEGCALVWDTKTGTLVYGLDHRIHSDDTIEAAVSYEGKGDHPGCLITGTKNGLLSWWPQPVNSTNKSK